MFQRIQTIFLFLAAAASIFMFFLPLGVFRGKVNGLETIVAERTLTSLSFSGQARHEARVLNKGITALFPSVSLLLSLASVFLYRNRKWQIILSKINLLTFTALSAYIFIFLGKETVPGSPPDSVIYLPGAYMPLLGILLTFFAIRGIRKDEELVRSADRIR